MSRRSPLPDGRLGHGIARRGRNLPEARRNHKRAGDQRGCSHDAVNLEHFATLSPIIIVPPGPFTELDAQVGAKGSNRNARFLDPSGDGLAAVRARGLDPPNAANCALCRLFRPRHQRPSRRGAAGGAARRPAGAGDRGASGQDAAVSVRGTARDADRDLRPDRQGGGRGTRLRRPSTIWWSTAAKREGATDPDPRPARRHRFRLRNADGRDERHDGAGRPDGLPAGEPRGAPDHRHFGAPDRQDGRRHHRLRAGAGRGPAESEICRQSRRLRTGSSHDPLLRPRGCAAACRARLLPSQACRPAPIRRTRC